MMLVMKRLNLYGMAVVVCAVLGMCIWTARVCGTPVEVEVHSGNGTDKSLYKTSVVDCNGDFFTIEGKVGKTFDKAIVLIGVDRTVIAYELCDE